jgi:hypothetical protein
MPDYVPRNPNTFNLWFVGQWLMWKQVSEIRGKRIAATDHTDSTDGGEKTATSKKSKKEEEEENHKDYTKDTKGKRRRTPVPCSWRY